MDRHCYHRRRVRSLGLQRFVQALVELTDYD